MTTATTAARLPPHSRETPSPGCGGPPAPYGAPPVQRGSMEHPTCTRRRTSSPRTSTRLRSSTSLRPTSRTGSLRRNRWDVVSTLWSLLSESLARCCRRCCLCGLNDRPSTLCGTRHFQSWTIRSEHFLEIALLEEPPSPF